MKTGKIAKARASWRRTLGNGRYKKDEYARRIPVHRDTLRKYLEQFGKWLSVWLIRDAANITLANRVWGRERVEDIVSSGNDAPSVTVAEVFELFHAHDLREEFAQYFLGKTHLSYEIAPAQPKPRTHHGRKSGPRYSKLAEFVFVILAEYVVLHNYCFVGRMRTKDMNTIDKWMRPI